MPSLVNKLYKNGNIQIQINFGVPKMNATIILSNDKPKSCLSSEMSACFDDKFV